MADSDKIRELKALIQLKIQNNELDKFTRDQLQQSLADLERRNGSEAEFNALLKITKTTVDAVSSSIDYVAKSFADSVNELSKANSSIREQKNNLTKLSKTARDLLDIRGGEAKVNDQILKKKREEIRIGKRNLEFIKAQGNFTGEQLKDLDDQIAKANELETAYKSIQETTDKTNKSLGALPALASGLDKALSKAGIPALGLAEALEATHMAAQEAAQAGGEAEASFSAMGTFTGNVSANLMDAVSPANIMQFALVSIVDALMDIDKQSGELAQNFGISFEQAQGLSSELNDIANSSSILSESTEGVTKAFTTLNNEFGTFSSISTEALESFIRLTEEAKLSEEAAIGLYRTTLLTGKTLEESASSVLGQVAALNASTGLAFNQKEILEEISKVSASTTLSLGAQPEALAEAVYKAKALGLELSKVEGIADSLLDFESSITNELEAEMLIGRDLNLEKARLLALNNDIAGVAEEIASQVGTAADYTKMNRIQQEALAKAVGMTKDDLATSLMEREALVKLTGIEGDTAKERFNTLVKEVGLEEAKKRIGDENLANMYASESIQDRFTQSVEKMKEIFVSVAEVLMPIFDIISGIVEVIAPVVGFVGGIIKKFEKLFQVLTAIYGISKLTNVASAVGAGIQERRLAAKSIELGLGGQILTVLGFQNAIAGYQLAKEGNMNTMRAIGVALEETKLGAIVATGVGMIKNLATGAVELAQRTAIAAANLVGVSASTLGIGTAIALAAAAGGIAYLNSVSKADDLMSPGQGASGYGSRTLLSPEGAFALNNKDTIIAGTNLGGSPGSSQSNNEQRRTNSLLERLLSKDSSVYMDSDRVGMAFAKSSRL
tara:strand:- start:1526 stop:4057 length:2532 start_codon:yes stop_codon:yes gene_type:complete